MAVFASFGIFWTSFVAKMIFYSTFSLGRGLQWGPMGCPIDLVDFINQAREPFCLDLRVPYQEEYYLF